MKNERKLLRKKQMGGLFSKYSDERGDYEGELYRSRITPTKKKNETNSLMIYF